MNKTNFTLKTFLLLIIFVYTSLALYSQDGYKTDRLRIKFNKTEEAKLTKMVFTKNSDGIIRTGMPSIDQLNIKHKASNIQRVFPYAGKFENKHREYGLHLWYEVKLDKKSDIERVSREYSDASVVSIAEPVYEKTRWLGQKNDGTKIDKSSLPSGTNDPRYNEQWHYNNTGQTGGTIDADIDLPEAWVIETGSTDVIVSVHDGGIDVDHVDIIGNMWINPGEIAGNGIDDDGNGFVDDINGYNFADNTGNIPADGHGTHVGGTIACETNNNTGMAGVAGGSGSDDGVRLMSCAVFANSVGGFPASYTYAADNGAVISQNSWGYTQPGDNMEAALKDAIDYFIAEAGKDELGNQIGPMAGGIVIFAAGNDGTNDLWYPGYYDKVMAIAGTDHNDYKYTSSNFGPWIELAAPAVNIFSTIPNDNYTGGYNGTSMACPHVSGTAALVLSHFKEDTITPQQLWDRLVNTTDPLTFEGAENWGSGRVNAFAALVEDDGQPPAAITDLSADSISAVSITFTWTAPADQPENYPASTYDFRGSLSPITEANFDLATKYDISAPSAPGEIETAEISGLNPGTNYYFAVKSADYFGNTSGISNQVSVTTNLAPEIVITGDPSVNIDVAVNPIGTGTFAIQNQGQVDLNFDIVPVFRGKVATQSSLIYPGTIESFVSNTEHNAQAIMTSTPSVNNNTATQFAFDSDIKNMISYDDGDDGADGEITVTAGGTPVNWSTATAFEVPYMGGEKFILTHLSAFIKAEGAAASKATRVSIVKGGETPDFGELLLIQEFDNVIGSQYVTVSLEMPIAFNTGDKFWIVYGFENVPLHMGYDDVPGGNRPGSYLAYLNGGWLDIQNQTGWGDYVWNVRAIESTLQGVSLNVLNGTLINGASQNIEVTYDASDVTRNGDYNFDIFVLSNDPVHPVEKVESTVGISGLPEPSLEINPDTINSVIDVAVNPIKKEILTISNTGSGELLFDFTNPIVDETVHVPQAGNDYPRGSGAESLGLAPMVSSTVNNYNTPITYSGSLAYGFEMYPGSSFISLSTDDPGTYISSSTVTYTTYAGDFGKGDDTHMFIIDNETGELKKLNVETTDITTIGASLKFSDLACDKQTGVMYGTLYSNPISELYTIDLTNGVASKIGDIGTGIMISMACDGDGNLWGLNLDDNVYAFDKNDGHMTLVGSAGFDANYAQSMAWDPVSGNIYMAAYNNSSNSGELRIVDTQTGATQLIGAFPGNAEVTSFGFPGGGGTDFASIAPLSGTVAPNSSATIEVTLDATELPNGEYNTSFNLYSNDYGKSAVTIPVNLEVLGQVGSIEISSVFLEFGAVFVNGERELPLVISNSGIGDLTISGLNSNLSSFTTDFAGPITLARDDSIIVTVKFKSGFLGQFNGILTVQSDDPDTPDVEVTVTATAISPPVISLTPTEIEKTMEAGTIATDQFTIRNYGMYPLQFSLPSVAVDHLLGNPDIQKNNTSRIEGLKGLNSKEEVDDRAGHPVVLGAGGPDELGYTWIDSEETGGPVFSWVDISATGTEILSNSDDGSLDVDLPFAFKFYGEQKTAVKISSNGYLTFGTDGTDYTNDQIPTEIEPNSFIAPFWDDLRPSSKRGQVFYQAYSNKFVVQYHEVGNYPSSTSGIMTFQVALYPNGNIEYLYKDFNLENNASATIGTENVDGTIGLQVAFNTDYVKDSLAVLIIPGRTPFQIGASPLSGIVQPNDQQNIELTIDATELNDGQYINELTISSNDPVRSEEIFTTKLNVNGHPQIAVEPDSVLFSPVFQGLSEVKSITITNTGSKDLIVSGISSNNTAFTVDFSNQLIIAPSQSIDVNIIFTAVLIGENTGSLIIESNDEYGNSSYTVSLKGIGLEPPVMTVTTMPSPIDIVMNSGDTDTITVYIENSGVSTLDYAVVKPYYTQLGDITVNTENNTPELSSKEEVDTRTGEPVQFGRGGPDQYGYSWADSDESSFVDYDWIEIKDIGVKLPLGADDGIWISLPFDFPFYGETHNEIQVASNGFLTFGDDLGFIGGFSNQNIPAANVPNNLIAPLWDDIEPQDGDGVYLYYTSEFAVIQYNEVPKFFGTGLATFQAILYPNGNIKYQYKDVSTYSGLTNATVGIENQDGSDALKVVFNSTYVKDQLAVLIEGPVFGSLESGKTAQIKLAIDASTIYDGLYEAPLRVSSNDPSNPLVELPTKLTVIGTLEISLIPDSVLFDEIYYIDGENYSDTEELIVRNTGSKDLTIDTLWFSPENPVFTVDQFGPFVLEPKEEQILSLAFVPNAIGSFGTSLFVSSNDSINPVISAELIGTAIEAPVFSVTPTDTLELELRSNGMATRYSRVGNLGGDLLVYSTNIVYLPDGFAQTDKLQPIYKREGINEKVYRSSAPATNASQNLGSVKYDVTFSDSIAYDPNRSPDDYYGYGGTAGYSSANRFIVASSNFKLTHVSNYYQNDGDNTPVIVEVYKGGQLPAQGTLVSTQAFTHAEAVIGGNYFIELETPVDFMNGDTFFITMHYPSTMSFPAAFNNGVSGVEGVSYWYNVNSSVWLAEDPGYVYKMRAFQASGSATQGWLSISPESGELTADDTLLHYVNVNAGATSGGYNYAKVVYNSNDPLNSVFEWPVKLYVNKLPVIVSGPTDTLYVDENDILEVTVIAADPEGGSVSYQLADYDLFTNLTTYNDSALVTYSPDYYQAGSKDFALNCTDDKGETTTVSWTVIINNVNREPVLLADIENKLYFPTDPTDYIDLSLYFNDPDGDLLTYSFDASTDSVCAFSIEDSIISITPLDLGLVVITVWATDAEGASAAVSFNARVRHSDNHAPILLGNIDNIIFFPSDSIASIDLDEYFIDIDWDVISYSFQLAGTASVNVSLAGSNLTLTPWQSGMAVLTIYANDMRGGLTATTFGVLVIGDANGLPFLAYLLGIRTYSLDDDDDIDLDDIFDDPDNDELSYVAKIESGESVEVEIVENTLKINPVKTGESVIVVYASDDKSGIATTRFIARVASLTDVIDSEKEILNLRNYPNPAKYNTTIAYQIPEQSHVRIEVIDLNGNSMDVLVDQNQIAGKYTLDYNLEKLASGIYIYRLLIDGKPAKVNRIVVE